MGAIGEGAGTITAGQRLQSAIATSRKIPQWDQNLIYISSNVAPLFALTDALKKTREVAGVSYFHLETDVLPTVVVTDAQYTSGLTTIGVTSGQSARLQVGTTLKVLRTSEMLVVTSVVADNNIGVSRGYAGTTPATINSGEEIAIIAFADTDGNTSPSGESSEPTQKLNYVQIFKQAIELSRRDQYTAAYGGDELPRLKKDALQKMMMNIERAMFFNNGVDSGSVSGRTQTGGVDYWLSTNVTNVAGLLTEQSWIDNGMRPWFRRNNNQDSSMYGFAGELFLRAANGWGRDGLRFRPDDNVAGINITEYNSEWGQVKFIKHGLFTPIGATVTAANSGWQGMFYGLNLDLVGKRVFKNSNLKFQMNIQTPDRDGVKHQYLADMGLFLGNEAAHLKLYGITG